MMQIHADMIHKAAAGDQDAITQLYELTYSPVYKTIRALIQDEDSVLDILQDSYIKAFQSLEQLETPEHFLPWLRRIATNKAKDYLKKKKPTLFSEMANEDGEEPEFWDDNTAHDPEAVLDQQETVRLMQQILGTLSEDQRMVIGMFYYQELSVRQIAEILECPENTVKSRLNYGRRKIEAKVRELEKQGVKLYSMSPISFLLWLFRQELAVAVLPSSGVLQAITAQCFTGAAVGAAAVGSAAVGGTAVGSTTAATGSAAVAAKVGAGILAAAVAVGGATAVIQANTLSTREAIQAIREVPLHDAMDYHTYLLTADLERAFDYVPHEYIPYYEDYVQYQTDGSTQIYGVITDTNQDQLPELVIGADTGEGVQVREIFFSVGGNAYVTGFDYMIDDVWENVQILSDGILKTQGPDRDYFFRMEKGRIHQTSPSDAPPLELDWTLLAPWEEDTQSQYTLWKEKLDKKIPGYGDYDYRYSDSPWNGFYTCQEGDWVVDVTELQDGTGFVTITSLSEEVLVHGFAQRQGGKWTLPWKRGNVYLDLSRNGYLTITADQEQSYCQTYEIFWTYGYHDPMDYGT